MSRQQSRNAKHNLQPRHEDKGRKKGGANLHLISDNDSPQPKKGKLAQDEADARAGGLFRNPFQNHCSLCKKNTDVVYALVYPFWEYGETDHWKDRKIKVASLCSGVCSREYDTLDYAEKMAHIR